MRSSAWARGAWSAVAGTALLALPAPAALAAPAIPHFARPTTPLLQDVAVPADEIASGDFNGDGLVDVIITRLGQEGTIYPVTILLNKGRGRFVDATRRIFVGAPPLTEHPRQIVVADFNDDGRADAFIADHGTDLPPFPGYQSSLILSQPGGKLVDATGNLPQESAFTHSAAAADVDGNGTIDLFYGTLNEPPKILLNGGTGHFRVAEGALPDFGGIFDYPGSAFVDVNGDGAPDVVLARGDSGGADRVLLNDGKGNFSFAPTPLPANAYVNNSVGLGIASGDINGDGRRDLVLAATQDSPFYVGANLQVLISNGDGTFRDETASRMPGEPAGDARWIAFPQLVDLNGDGKLDLLTHEDGSSAASPAYLNNGNGVFVPLNVGAYTEGMWTFVNDKPHQRARDVLAVSDQGELETYIFYRRIK